MESLDLKDCAFVLGEIHSLTKIRSQMERCCNWVEIAFRN